jgi:hypothetical protein
MQSWGYRAAPARLGQRRIDLICSTFTKGEQYSFLVDAKTSAAAYIFPTSDQRAIEEYVVNFRERSEAFPSLKFVLLVGSRAAASVGARLTLFSDKIGVVCRCVAASDLARLRRAIIGPLLPVHFRDELLKSAPVVDANFVDRLVARHKVLYGSTYQDLVDDVFRN